MKKEEHPLHLDYLGRKKKRDEQADGTEHIIKQDLTWAEKKDTEAENRSIWTDFSHWRQAQGIASWAVSQDDLFAQILNYGARQEQIKGAMQFTGILFSDHKNVQMYINEGKAF